MKRGKYTAKIKNGRNKYGSKTIQKGRILKTKKCNARAFVERHVELHVNHEHENDRGADNSGKWENGDMRKRESEVL